MNNKTVYIETYGCQMNLSDTEVVSSLLKDSGFHIINKPDTADVILLNTCSIRENAERKIFEKLTHLKQYKKKNSDLLVGIIGCMAERLDIKNGSRKTEVRSQLTINNSQLAIDNSLLTIDNSQLTIDNSQLTIKKDDRHKEAKFSEKHERLVDEMVSIAVGPDEYRNIPGLIYNAMTGVKSVAVELGTSETYDDIIPLRTEGTSAWLAITRGCNNFCSYCVVPYTRGKERSRPFDSLIKEVQLLERKGFREVTLLGQNVNSYRCPQTRKDFPDLLRESALAAPGMRFRFMTSHPKDISDKLIDTIAGNDNICNHIHLAMQSGSNRILKLMHRVYTIEHFLERIGKIKEKISGCSLTTDIIAGFPTETMEDHEATLNALKQIEYDGAFMFRYSPRENTKAYELVDDVPEEEKLRRLNEIIHLQQNISKKLNEKEIGRIHEVVLEGVSKKSDDDWFGRTETNKVVILKYRDGMKTGDKVFVKINSHSSATLKGEEVI